MKSINSITKLITGISLALIILLPSFGAVFTANVSALSGSFFQAGRIIDDSVFTNQNAMTVQQIQNFLNAKVGTCDTNGTQPSTHWDSAAGRDYTHAEWGALNGNPAPFTCINEFAENTANLQNNFSNPGAVVPGSITAAQIIWDAAQAYNINPEVILTTLQKEQGLVTDNWPWYNEYQSAMGYGCPDSSGCSTSYADFFKQVDGAAWQFRYYLNHPGAYNYWIGNNFILYNPNAACGGSTVNIQNAATAALYIYTPYQPDQAALNNVTGTGDSCSAYGNRNFWYYFNTWFGSSVGTDLLEGTTSTVYLVNSGTRYAIPSSEVFNDYGLEGTAVTPASDSYIGSLTDGGVLNTLFTMQGDPTVYVADVGRKIGIPSGAMCTAWGFNCSGTIPQIGFDIGNNLANGGVLQPLLAYKNTVYNMQAGVRSPYLSAQAVTQNGANLSEVTVMGSVLNIGTSVGPPIIANGTLVQFPSAATVYYYTNSHFYAIPDGNTFNNWFGSASVNLDQVSSYAGGPPVITGVLNSIFKTGANNTYLINNGSRIDLTAVSTSWPTAMTASELDTVVTNMPLAAAASSSSTYRTPDGAVSLMSGGQRMIIPSMNDFNALGYNLNGLININQATLNSMPLGPYAVGEGSVFKVSNDPTSIYLKGPTNSIYYLTSQDQLGQFQLTRVDPVLPASQLSQYTTPAPLSSFVNILGDTSQPGVVDATHKLWLLGSTAKSNWGIGSPASANISSSGLTYAGLTFTNAQLPSFASYNGTVYYGNGGVKHPIATNAAYVSLGGNASNTFYATQDFINASPTGSIL